MPALTVFPSAGDSTLFFDFNAGKSIDDRSYKRALQYRWDFEGDGVWDTDYHSGATIAHQFTQPGHYTPLVEVKDIDGFSAIARDSVAVFGRNQDIDTLYDSRDGNRYRIVKIGGNWWMAENLRYGIVIPTDREQTDNDTVERYQLSEDKHWDTIGGIYLWLEAKNHNVNDINGICPGGWHMPTKQEWESLFAPYPMMYSLGYYGKEGLSNLNLDLNNGGFREGGLFQKHRATVSSDAGFWSSSFSKQEQEYLPYYASFNSPDQKLVYGYWQNTGLTRYYSVRCVKDKSSN